MAKKYFIWKNGNPNEWAQISGREFYALVKSDEGCKRHFIHLSSVSDPNTEPDDIYMESTLEEYRKHLQEKNHSDYLNRFSQNICLLSLEQSISDDSDNEKSLHEILSSTVESVDEQAIQNILKSNLRKAVQGLLKDELQLVDALFVRRISQEQFAEEQSITQQMVSKQKKKVIKKLKLLVVGFEKNQQ